MLSDPDAFHESKEQRQARVERVVRGVVGEAVALELTAGRRKSDLWLLHLRGRKALVLELPLKILDQLPHEDLELVSSSGDDADYRLTLVVTLPLEQQPTTTPERRSKLRYMLGSKR
jgi:hypothetical protein